MTPRERLERRGRVVRRDRGVRRRQHLNWLIALLVGSLASGVALVLQNVLRSVWQIRTLPERVMEWLLLFVPPDLFERGLARLGTDAKQLALVGTVAGMAIGLAVIGAVGLRFARSSYLLLALGGGLWLFAMVVVMPVTGAGLFATRLLFAPLLTDSGYLLVFLGFATVLVAAGLLLTRRPGAQTRPPIQMADRRALITGVVGTLLAASLAKFAGRDGGLVASSLPLAQAPTRQPVPPAPQPVTSDANPLATPDAIAAATPITAPVAPVPTLTPLPDPGPARHLARDQDGSLTAAGRPKGQLASQITTNEDFYIVTKNAVADPVVDAAGWRLVIDGEVNRPVQVDYRTLSMLPAVEVTKTLECISNFTAGCNLTSFGCDLMSTARWKGARLSDVLDLAGGLKPSAVGLAFYATDEFSAGLPMSVAKDPETLVVYEMNGEPLPREHGFPMRLLVPGRYGMKNPKWLAGIRVMDQEYQGWYEQRNWNRDGIVKTMSRIDVPLDGALLASGEQRVAGIAYAGDRGVQQVEISTDDGTTWQTTRLLERMAGKDAMVRWESTFTLPSTGSVNLIVRATDGSGTVQTDEFQLPEPDGASGRDQITVSAA